MADRRLARGELDPETLRWVAQHLDAIARRGTLAADTREVLAGEARRIAEIARLEAIGIRARQKRRRAK